MQAMRNGGKRLLGRPLLLTMTLFLLVTALGSGPAQAAEPQWTAMTGTLDFGVTPIYGKCGIEDSKNRPGGRVGMASWTDASGKLWLFGGLGFDSNGYRKYLNDLWRFDPATGNWAWIKGSATDGQAGTYGTLGVADPLNTPGARYDAVSWTDATGKLWLFGGLGCANKVDFTYLNDLWRFDPATGNWTWMKGASTGGQAGTYGTLGVADPSNTPGARSCAVSWIDTTGKLWLFGGGGYDNQGNFNYLNDLWRFDPATGNWTWMKGASTGGQAGTYGTLGVADPLNTPSARSYAVSWMDTTGKLWLFGGYGYDNKSRLNYFNDLWRFDPTTGNWTWMKGASTANQAGTYGTLEVEDVTNTPGARYGAVSWTDAAGNFWLFGGVGNDSTGKGGYLNDVWHYDPATGNWTWMKGASTVDQAGTYGTLGVENAANTPGTRAGAVSWTDAAGKLWLLGGLSYNSTGRYNYNNDLWRFDPATDNWTWMKGASTGGQAGTYGTLGVEDVANTPGARRYSVSWTDAAGKLWLFGGYGYDSKGFPGFLNDLWCFDPTTGNWTWMKGASTGYHNGTYGTLGVEDAANTPGARSNAVSWTDASGKFWLFGGYGYSMGNDGFQNDLWRYDPATGNWTWMKGAATRNQSGVYETRGVADEANTPGARYAAASWTAHGRLWLFGGGGYDCAGYVTILGDLWVINNAQNACTEAWSLYQ